MNKKRGIKTKTALVTTMAILAPVVLSHCALSVPRHWSAIEGRVVEKDTHDPIENALVVVRYRGRGHNLTQCFNIEMARTGGKGKYQIPTWTNVGPSASLKNQHMHVLVHSPGFKRGTMIANPGDSGETIYMEEFSGNREEYMEQLLSLTGATNCHGRVVEAETRAKVLRTEQQIVEIIYDEALSVVDDQEELTRLEGIYLGSIELHLARKIVLREFDESDREYSSDIYDERVREVLQDRFQKI